MEIQKFEQRYMLLTMSGQKIEISENQETQLRKTSNNKLVKLNGITINTSTISAIIPLQEYYKQHPEEKPINIETFSAPKQISFTKQRYIKTLDRMIESFKGVFKGRNIPEQSQNILTFMIMKRKQAEDLNDNAKIEIDPVKMFGYKN